MARERLAWTQMLLSPPNEPLELLEMVGRAGMHMYKLFPKMAIKKWLGLPWAAWGHPILEAEPLWAVGQKLAWLAPCYVFKQPNKLSTDVKFKRCLEVVDRKSTRLNSSHALTSRMPSSA